MRLLLDTHILLWSAAEPGRLSAHARALLEDPANELIFSVASLWEVAIKLSGKGLEMPIDVERLRSLAKQRGYAELEIKAGHALSVARLPSLHRDPFDRMLIAQARVEGMSLITVDKQMIAYGAPVIKA